VVTKECEIGILISHYGEEAKVAFIRNKRVNGKEYAQVVENYREGGKVRQRTLLHLGPYTPAAALVYWQAFADQPGNGEAKCKHYAAKVARLRELIEQGKVKITDDDMRQVEEERVRRLKRLEEITARFAR
jgi:hypothetical protein